MKLRHWIINIIAFIGLVGMDQWTKWMAATNLKESNPFVLWDGVFEFYYFENYGAAFGILQNQRILLIIRIPNTKRYLPIRIVGILVAAGAVGNFIDRIYHGYVIDFLYFKLINFPIFNLADCYVVVSMVLLTLLICFYYKDEDFEVLKKKIV